MTDAAAPRILVVDDNEANRYAVSRMLRAAGFETFEATTGRQAIQLARQNPAMIVLDVNLPDLNGFDVVRELRSSPATELIPILHLSASYTRNEDHVFGLDNGANAFLTHPILPPLFLATVRTLLRARRIEEERAALLTVAERAREEAEAANRSKSEFLATMSHEIRTPINAILGYAQILDMGLAGPITPEQRWQLDRTRRSAAHLLTLVNELLDLAKVESGTMRIDASEARLDDVVEDALAISQPQALARGISIVSDRGATRPLTFIGDAGRVRQILVNLLSNAVKFSEPGGRITLNAEVRDAPEGTPMQAGCPCVVVQVSDNGIGVERGKLTSIFEPFVQAETGPTRTWGGSGLGLAISRRLARLMGGDITVVSEAGVGSSFWLWMPASGKGAMNVTSENRAANRSAAPIDRDELAQLGRVVSSESLNVAQFIALRVRTDKRFPPAGGLSDSQLIDHIPVYVMDLGLALVIVSDVGIEASTLLHDGNAIRNEVAHLHGAQRRRIGWDESHVLLEYDLVQEELERLLTARAGKDEGRLEAPLALLRQLIEQLAAASSRGHREARAADD